MSKTVNYYHFLISPYSYIAIDQFNALVAKHNLAVNYLPVAPMQVFSETGGVPPAQRHPSRQKLRMDCLLYTSPSPRDLSTSRMPSSA